MQRITIKHLNFLCVRLNELTNSPKVPYVRTEDGLVAQIGNFHISQAYGGYCLHRMHNSCGGVITPLSVVHVTARELYIGMSALLRGIEYQLED